MLQLFSSGGGSNMELPLQMFGVSSVGIANSKDIIGYTTDYYTVGVANTVQTIGAGETTMIMPSGC